MEERSLAVKRPTQEKKRSKGMWVSGLANRWPERAHL